MNHKPSTFQMSPQSPRLGSEDVQEVCAAQTLSLSGWYALDGPLFLLVTALGVLLERLHSHTHLFLYRRLRPLRRVMSMIRRSAMLFQVKRRQHMSLKGRFDSRMNNQWQ